MRYGADVYVVLVINTSLDETPQGRETNTRLNLFRHSTSELALATAISYGCEKPVDDRCTVYARTTREALAKRWQYNAREMGPARYLYKDRARRKERELEGRTCYVCMAASMQCWRHRPGLYEIWNNFLGDLTTLNIMHVYGLLGPKIRPQGPTYAH